MANKIDLRFAATNRYEVEAIPQNTSVVINGRDFVAWGADNKYPEFLSNLYQNCSTLSSIINGMTDFVCGNEITVTNYVENDGILEDEIRNLVRDYLIYGIAYLNVLRNAKGEVATVKWIDTRNIRSNEDNTVFFYSADWSKSYGRVKTIVLPKYQKTGKDVSSIVMIKDYDRDVYPTPKWGAAIDSVVTEIEIGKYHLNEILNNFTASAIINFNNGVPSDEDKDEIEKMIQEKFCSAENAGRFVLAFNNNKESAVTIERLGTDDFDKRYDAVAKKTRQEIFTAFRANPNLFGIPTENLGFSAEEYESSFKLFNRTSIRPLQKLIVRTFDKLGIAITITPFSLEEKRNGASSEEKVDE